MVQSSFQLSPASSANVPSDELTYARLLSTIWRRRYWFLPMFLGSVGLAIAASFLLKPTYESRTQILLEPNIVGSKSRYGQQLRPEDDIVDPSVEIDYATQLNLMRSPQLLQQVLDDLKADYPDMELEEFQKDLRVEQLTEQQDGDKKGTKVVRVVYSDSDPVKTLRVLNVLQGIYQEYNQQQQNERLTKGLAFINAQIPVVQKRLAESESALEAFRKRNNLIDPEQQSQVVTESLNQVQQERRATRSEYQDTQARYAALSQQVGKTPNQALTDSRITESARFQKNLDQLQEIEFELAAKQAQFTDDSPMIQDLKMQRQRILALLPEEMRRIMGAKAVNAKNAEALLNEGQMSNLDIKLVDQLVAANTDLKALSARDQVLAQSESQLQAQLNKFPALMAEYGRLQPEVEMHRELLQNLRAAEQEIGMEIARGGFEWKVLEAPQLGKDVGPSLVRNLALGVVVGLFLGGLAAFLRDMSDDAVYTSDDLRRNIDLSLLGMIPELPKVGDKILPQEVLSVSKLPAGVAQLIHWAPFRESMDLVYQNMRMPQRTAPKSVIMTSALPQEGKSTLSLGLAMSAARLNHRVLIIDADLRNPSLHRKLDISNDEGLSTILSDASAQVKPRHMRFTEGCEVDVLTAGSSPMDSPKLLSSLQWRKLIRAYEAEYDLVVVDAPPVLGMVDTLLMASVCEGVVMTARMSVITRSELSEALDTLSQFNVVGVIANGMERKAAYYAMEKTPEERLAVLSTMVAAQPVLSVAVNTPLPTLENVSMQNLAAKNLLVKQQQDMIQSLREKIKQHEVQIQEQQQELDDKDWTIDDLRKRQNLTPRNPVSTASWSSSDEVQYAEQERLVLQESLDGQKEKLEKEKQELAEQQRLLDEYCENLMKGQQLAQDNENSGGVSLDRGSEATDVDAGDAKDPDLRHRLVGSDADTRDRGSAVDSSVAVSDEPLTLGHPLDIPSHSGLIALNTDPLDAPGSVDATSPSVHHHRSIDLN